MRVHDRLEELLEADSRAELEARLLSFLTARRWYRSKSRTTTGLSIEHAYVVAVGRLIVVTVRVRFAEPGETEDYVLPLTWVAGDEGVHLAQTRPHLVVAAVAVDGEARPRWLIDAIGQPHACTTLLSFLADRGRAADGPSTLVARLLRDEPSRLAGAPRPVESEQSNSSVVYGESCILKVLRQLEGGTSPELEMGEALGRAAFDRVPALLGAIEIDDGSDERRTVAVLHAFAPNRGDAFGAVVSRLGAWTAPDAAGQAADGLPFARLLGERTAGLHRALASPLSGAGFAPEPLDRHEREALAARLTGSLAQTLDIVRTRIDTLPPDMRSALKRLVTATAALSAIGQRFVELGGGSTRMRIHGDLHLGQMLIVDGAAGLPPTDPGDILIVDFEGEPARSLTERRAKRSPLVDVAGVMRSLDYAAILATADAADVHGARAAVNAWRARAEAALLEAYVQNADASTRLPATEQGLAALMHFYLLEKCVYEMLYEMDNRPAWVSVPLHGLLRLIEPSDAS